MNDLPIPELKIVNVPSGIEVSVTAGTLQVGEVGMHALMFLSRQMTQLEQQFVVLSLATWVSLHAPWLEVEGFFLYRASGARPPKNQSELDFPRSTDELNEDFPAPPGRTLPAIELYSLAESMPDSSRDFFESLIECLNQVRWNPIYARAILINHLPGIEDPDAWLTQHAVSTQANALQSATPMPEWEQARSRL